MSNILQIVQLSQKTLRQDGMQLFIVDVKMVSEEIIEIFFQMSESKDCLPNLVYFYNI